MKLGCVVGQAGGNPRQLLLLFRLAPHIIKIWMAWNGMEWFTGSINDPKYLVLWYQQWHFTFCSKNMVAYGPLGQPEFWIWELFDFSYNWNKIDHLYWWSETDVITPQTHGYQLSLIQCTEITAWISQLFQLSLAIVNDSLNTPC